MTIYSILLPVNRIDKYLIECLESIRTELCKDGELVIVLNGGLKVENLLKLKDTNLSLIELINNAKVLVSNCYGLSSALTIGLNSCSGEFILRMDSDDIMIRGRIRLQVDYLLNNPKINVVGGCAKLLDNNSTLLSKRIGLPNDPGVISKMLKIHCALIHPTVCFRKEIINKVGGYALFGFAEDYDLWTRIIRFFPDSIIVLNNDLIEYRVHDKQVTKSTSFFLKELYRKFIQIREFIFCPKISTFLYLFVPMRIGFKILSNSKKNEY